MCPLCPPVPPVSAAWLRCAVSAALWLCGFVRRLTYLRLQGLAAAGHSRRRHRLPHQVAQVAAHEQQHRVSFLGEAEREGAKGVKSERRGREAGKWGKG